MIESQINNILFLLGHLRSVSVYICWAIHEYNWSNHFQDSERLATKIYSVSFNVLSLKAFFLYYLPTSINIDGDKIVTIEDNHK